jgi:hypothetical protein
MTYVRSLIRNFYAELGNNINMLFRIGYFIISI